MRIIVCGAGQVGSSIARKLSQEDNDVIVIDQSPTLIQNITDTLDVQARVGFASHPTLLEEVGAAEADMLIAVTQSDEVNMVACQVAHSLFNIPTKIARIRNQNYLAPQWHHLYRHDHLPIDFIISPEVEVAKAILHRFHVPGAVETIPFANGVLKTVGLRCTLDCPMVNIPISKIQKRLSEFQAQFLGVLREDQFLVSHEKLVLLEDDELYFIAQTANLPDVMELFGFDEREARRVIIIGGGNIGLFIASELEAEPNTKVRLVEISKERAEFVAEQLHKTTVINGDALSQEILDEAHVSAAESVIAVSNDDEVNILSTLLSKRFGARHAVALVNNSAYYSPLMGSLGIDVTVNPKDITVSGILQHIRQGRILSAHSICKGKAELIEAEAVDASFIVGKALADVHLPEGIVIGMILREDVIILPEDKTVINARDKVIILCQSHQVSKVERFFSVQFDFF